MNIQWYPGHMTKTRRMIAEQIKHVDAVCEIVDARIPVSSRNPDVDELTAGKPRLIVLNRVDQADPEMTKKWAAYFRSLGCAVIDPGDESNTILYYLEDNHLTCRAILLTHGHYDHTGAVYAVHEETGAPVYMNALDAGTAVAFDSYTFTPPEGTIFYKEGDEVKVGNLTFRVMETPGHTPGGVTLICGDALFTGDTLFAGSCGRTDFAGGSMEVELQSLAKIAALPGDYEVYPGHMDPTTLERERNFNYYCREASK